MDSMLHHMQVDEDQVWSFLQGIEQGESPYDFWMLPHDFVSRAVVYNSQFEIIPFGREKMLPFRRCHHTVMHLIELDDSHRAEYATGFAFYRLYQSNHWARHSWVMNKVDGIILEPTPNQYDIYVGVILTPEEMAFMNKEIWS